MKKTTNRIYHVLFADEHVEKLWWFFSDVTPLPIKRAKEIPEEEKTAATDFIEYRSTCSIGNQTFHIQHSLLCPSDSLQIIPLTPLTEREKSER